MHARNAGILIVTKTPCQVCDGRGRVENPAATAHRVAEAGGLPLDDYPKPKMATLPCLKCDGGEIHSTITLDQLADPLVVVLEKHHASRGIDELKAAIAKDMAGREAAIVKDITSRVDKLIEDRAEVMVDKKINGMLTHALSTLRGEVQAMRSVLFDDFGETP